MLSSLDHGRYSVGRALSQGGMGALYLATDHGAFDRTVVVKMLLDAPRVADEAERRAAHQRFADEARTLAALQHPFIPKIFAYFSDGAACFIVMEHINGRDLQQGLTRADEADKVTPGAPFPAADVARWGAALCGVLEYLAAQRPQPMLHQDIKPANLVLDQHSGTLFLVDFGTAQAHSGNHTGGYGTPGYAPPEQYRGQSEPRSDMYALAATLYHLASDDDPGLHPFSFPQLDALGELGDALRPALSKDIAARPHAADLRRTLEALGRAAFALTLAAPDGTTLYYERQVAQWCEHNWGQATQWLRSRALPSELEQLWGKPALARRLRAAVAQHPADDHAALDATLALLDPQGYGAARPDLAATPVAIECKLRRGALEPTTLTVTNQGRRYVRMRPLAPRWLAVSAPVAVRAPGFSARSPSLGLAPGQNATLLLSGTPPRGVLGPNSAEVLELQHEDTSGLVTGNVLARVPLREKLRWRVPQGAYLAALLPLLVIAACVISVFWPNPMPQPPTLISSCGAKGSYEWELCAGAAELPTLSGPYTLTASASQTVYEAARGAANIGRWREAYDLLQQLDTDKRRFFDDGTLMRGVSYQLALQSYGAKQWGDLNRYAGQVVNIDRGYKDAEFLYKESLYHPAKIAFEQGDYAKAQAALREVWLRDPAYLDVKVLLAQCYTHLADKALAQDDLAAAAQWVRAFELLRSDYPDLRRLQGALETAHNQPAPTVTAVP